MKHLPLIGLFLGAILFAGCETTETAGSSKPAGNAEVRRVALLEERRQQEAHMDESQKNLWNAQNDILNRDGNAHSGQ